ncbi:MAG: hypothetical protein CMP22_06245 [Rickettsiales bacterium]|nr:hypothetical protein [Rickettsiales bacterium]|tara:strand:+ start:303 stop:1229 length:927 start_codon:yes stop_codon:yes gene_type:complete
MFFNLKKKKPKAPTHYDYFNEQAALPELVVVLHGLKATPRSMRKMNAYLTACGYSVASPCLDYDHLDVEGIVEQIHEKVGDKIENYKKVHFVGYSMGGMALRAYLSQHFPEEKMGNAIQIGAPNQGSLGMRLLMKIPGVKSLAGPMAVQVSKKKFEEDLTDKHAKPAHFFPEKIPYKLGVIAGDAIKGLKDIFNALILPGGDDGIVTLKETAFNGMTDHIIIDDHHVGLSTSNKSMLLVSHFLKNATFDPFTSKNLTAFKVKRGLFNFLKPCMKGSIDRLLIPTRWFIRNSRRQIEELKTNIKKAVPF